jgi:hypothetical protein
MILTISDDIDFWYMKAVKSKMKFKTVSCRQENIKSYIYRRTRT